MEATETEINIQKWGLGFSVPKPLGQPRPRCSIGVNNLCLPGQLLFVLLRIASPGATKTAIRYSVCT